MKLKSSLIMIFSGIVYFLTFSIYCHKTTNKAKLKNYEIEIQIKECINCGFLDVAYKKSIRISNQEIDKVFSPTDITEMLETRIILGKSKEYTQFKNKGIKTVIVFPNEREKIETFNFDTGEDLNKIENGSFIWGNYYSGWVNKITDDIVVELDTIIR